MKDLRGFYKPALVASGGILLLLGDGVAASASSFSASYKGQASTTIVTDPDGTINLIETLTQKSLLGFDLPKTISLAATGIEGHFSLDPAHFLDGDITIGYQELEQIESYLPAFITDAIDDVINDYALDSLGLTEEVLDSVFDVEISGAGSLIAAGQSPTSINVTYDDNVNTLTAAFSPITAEACLTSTCNASVNLDFSASLVLNGLQTFLENTDLSDLPADVQTKANEIKGLIPLAQLFLGDSISLLEGTSDFAAEITPITYDSDASASYGFRLTSGDLNGTLDGEPLPTYSVPDIRENTAAKVPTLGQVKVLTVEQDQISLPQQTEPTVTSQTIKHNWNATKASKSVPEPTAVLGLLAMTAAWKLRKR